MTGDENENDSGEFTINYDNVVACKECMTMTRILAADLKNNPYMTVGMFLQSLSDADVTTLQGLVDANSNLEEEDEVDDPRMADVVLMAEMLARAEGITSADDVELHKKVNQFMVMITLESLYRKGLVKLYHDNMSFGDDAGDRIVVEKI